jgi:HSP20 family protein
MLTRWDPFSELHHMQDRLSRSLGGAQDRGSAFAPPVDIYEAEGAITIKAELPGVDANDVNIDVENNVLTIRGTRKFENEDKREGYHRIERSYGSFTRSFMMPNTIESENIEATMQNGVLTLTLPKKAATQPRRINVRSGGAQAQQGAMGAASQGAGAFGQGAGAAQSPAGAAGAAGASYGAGGGGQGALTPKDMSGAPQPPRSQEIAGGSAGAGSSAQQNGGARVPVGGASSASPAR